MKKKGFSLAEVLITLTIIGVIAALSIPQFTADVHNQSNAAKLAPVVTDFENVFGLMLLREDREGIYETQLGAELMGNNSITGIRDALENYTRISRAGTNLNSLGYQGDPPTRDINGGTINIQNNGTLNGIVTPNGAIVFFTNVFGNTGVSTIFIDTNGPTQPNRIGRDIFAFVLSSDGHLCPYGSRQAAIAMGESNPDGLLWSNSNASTDYKCTGSNYSGMGCTARLIENNYKPDY